jgi:hypothetical protein
LLIYCCKFGFIENDITVKKVDIFLEKSYNPSIDIGKYS